MIKTLTSAIAGIALSVNQAFAVTVSDSRGPHEFDAPPKRVVVLTWSMAEQVLELDVKPIAIADVEGYNTWVVQPKLPINTESVGLRHEPNIERIAELKPDVIILSDDQIYLADTLEKIAPVLHFEDFSADHDNAAQARHIYLELAKLFGREVLAKERLSRLDAQLKELSGKLREHFQDRMPKVVATRLLDRSHVRVYGTNSMAEAALNALGLEPALPQPNTQWGFALKRIEDLGAISDGVVVNIGPFPASGELFPTPLWQAMPFVNTGQFASVEPAWTYGGIFSVGYLAEAFTQALLTLGN